MIIKNVFSETEAKFDKTFEYKSINFEKKCSKTEKSPRFINVFQCSF